MRERDRLLARLAALVVGPEEPIASEVADAAVAEEVAPLLHARGRAAATPEIAKRLASEHARCLARNLVAERALARLAGALAARDVPALLLKGAALLRLVYRTPGERPMHDVDVLVPRERFSAALAAAAEVGTLVSGRPDRPITERLDYVRSVALPPGAVVEIHRGIASRPLFRLDTEGLFRRARRDADGIYVPDADDLFVILAAHAAKHGFVVPFRAVVDGLLLAPQVTPATAVRRAAEWRARPALAAWLGVLARFGLRGAAWNAAHRELGPAARARAAIACRDAPLADDAPWRRTVRIALLLEGLRGGAYVAQRTAFRLADLLHG